MGKRWSIRFGTAAVVAATVLGQWASLPAKAADDDCRVHGGDPDTTAATLKDRTKCTQDDLDRLYASLGAGPMPTNGTSASGVWRWDNAWDPLGPTQDQFSVPPSWDGKAFYTDAEGINRWAQDARAFPGRVTYGSGMDGKRAILIDYSRCATPDSQFASLFLHDEIRLVQRDVYLGFGWLENSRAWAAANGVSGQVTRPFDPYRREVIFVLNFHHPDVQTGVAGIDPPLPASVPGTTQALGCVPAPEVKP
jgi:hypothetical protein